MIAAAPRAEDSERERAEIGLASRADGSGLSRLDLSVPGIHCGGCVRRIEDGLSLVDGVVSARVNLSTKRTTVLWRGDSPPAVLDALARLGFEAHLPEQPVSPDRTRTELVRALAVAGFATANVMSFSVAVWAGAEPGAQIVFNWVAAAIALPAVGYAGTPFFRSAWRSLAHRRLNMDVPISIGVLLTVVMSLHDTIVGERNVYFDAAVSLLFVLLVGRTLDHMMREKARTAAAGLEGLIGHGAMLVRPDGSVASVPVADLQPGMVLRLAPGERVPVDGVVLSGRSAIDVSLVTGESAPVTAAAGFSLSAGMLNLSSSIDLTVTAVAEESFLSQTRRLMEKAESGRTGYRRIADHAAQLYAPIVHLAALAALVFWLLAGADLHQSLTIAISVLIITCPCALGLAVPMVQVVAAQRLFASGVLVKDGSALERLRDVDTVVFDKTGTLTLGEMTVMHVETADPGAQAVATSVASHSRHPHARAISGLAGAAATTLRFDEIREHPGFGVEARTGSSIYRFGRADWALGRSQGTDSVAASETLLTRDGEFLARFTFEDQLRPGSRETVAALGAHSYKVALLSGDSEGPVAEVAQKVRITSFRAALKPSDKVEFLEEMRSAGRKTLMVGDGLNDAPALAAAHVSMAPGSAADISRNAADLIFLRKGLEAVPFSLDIARQSHRLIRQNFALAVSYNLIAVPLAFAGLVTPLIAAVAMSLSSLTVVANALRLRGHASLAATTTVSNVSNFEAPIPVEQKRVA